MWAVYDSHFDAVYRCVIEASRQHPVLGAALRSMTFEQVGTMAQEYRLLVKQSFEGDPSGRDAYLGHVARAYADAGLSFDEWSVFDSALMDVVTPLIVATYGGDSARMIAALKALREFTHRTTVVLAGAYITKKERALVESEARYRQLVDRSPEAIVVHVEGRVEFANDAAAQTLGFPGAGELVGRQLADIRCHDDTAVGTSPGMAPSGAGATGASLVESVERYARSDDGREITLEVRSIPIVYEGHEATFAVARNITERLEAEAARRRALDAVDLERRRLVAILDALPVGIWIADASGRVTFTNPGASQLLGRDAPHPTAIDRYSDECRAVWPTTGLPLLSHEWPMARTLRSGQSVLREAVDVVRVGGTKAHVLLSSAPIPGSDGQPDGAMVVALDITDQQRSLKERERLLASLEFERQRLGALFENAPAAITLVRGGEHVVELANAEMLRLFGARDVIGKNARAAYPALVRHGLVDILDRVLVSGEPFVGRAMPIEAVKGDGTGAETRFIDVVWQAVVEADGTATGVFGHVIDVTDREVAAQRTRAQFKAMPIPTYAWQRRLRSDGTPEFVLKDYNDAALLITRGGAAMLLGVTASEALEDAAEGIIADMTAALDEARPIRREVVHCFRASGETRRFFTTYASVLPDLVLVHTEDITERFELEEQLRSAQKMEAIGRLAGGVAHDFNNILSVILGYTSLMIDDLPIGDPLRNDVVEMETAAQRAVALTQQLLALGRRQVLQPRRMDLAASVRGLEPMLRRLLGEGIEFTIEASAELGGVFADPTQIDQVIMNLVVNARDAMPTGGKLAITLENVAFDASAAARDIEVRPERYVLLAVTDNGTGMDRATLAKIFEPFFTTKEQGKGTGLGLATVFGVVRQSDGLVRAESAVGKGTTIKVLLPRVDGERSEAAKASSLPARAEAPRGTETVLLVEDDHQVRVLSGNVLRRQGYKVLEAENAADALLLAERYEASIDLLLTDVVMPRMSGRELAEHLSPTRPRMKVLYMSGYTDDAMMRHGIATSEHAFLQKPVSAAELARKVRSVLDVASPAVVFPKPLY